MIIPSSEELLKQDSKVLKNDSQAPVKLVELDKPLRTSKPSKEDSESGYESVATRCCSVTSSSEAYLTYLPKAPPICTQSRDKEQSYDSAKNSAYKLKCPTHSTHSAKNQRSTQTQTTPDSPTGSLRKEPVITRRKNPPRFAQTPKRLEEIYEKRVSAFSHLHEKKKPKTKPKGTLRIKQSTSVKFHTPWENLEAWSLWMTPKPQGKENMAVIVEAVKKESDEPGPEGICLVCSDCGSTRIDLRVAPRMPPQSSQGTQTDDSLTELSQSSTSRKRKASASEEESCKDQKLKKDPSNDNEDPDLPSFSKSSRRV
ncbi:hypothetical protein L596_022169 [Steinernema carpocapsae]|uniref:Uncharacterized protein n=1 Tax=Steinernema carpocapsae TaxID=34508 RepID=A0A4U5ML05_STECR|nr:hypothetical protein L596_022169 [Steinernema carpocapsae]